MATKLLMNLNKINFISTRCIKHSSVICCNLNGKKLSPQSKDSKKLGFYILNRYVNYIKNYDKVIEKRFPKAMDAYRVFIFGVKEFYRDLKDFLKVAHLVHRDSRLYSNLNRKEIELYYQMPRDILKLAPILIFSSLPFAYYILLPLIVYFPRQLLTSHFWNLQQKKEFSIMYLQKRLMYHRPVFRHLQARLKKIDDKLLQEKWANILGLIGSGVQPSIEEILECKELFDVAPYDLKYLSRNHIRQLAKMHGLPGFWFRSSRLKELSRLLHAMDMAMIKEGGVHNISQDSLRRACIIRGLNPSNMRTEDMIEWLKQWIQISVALKENYPSLLLHSPILLGYNQPSNWILIYSKKKL